MHKLISIVLLFLFCDCVLVSQHYFDTQGNNAVDLQCVGSSKYLLSFMIGGSTSIVFINDDLVTVHQTVSNASGLQMLYGRSLEVSPKHGLICLADKSGLWFQNDNVWQNVEIDDGNSSRFVYQSFCVDSIGRVFVSALHLVDQQAWDRAELWVYNWSTWQKIATESEGRSFGPSGNYGRHNMACDENGNVWVALNAGSKKRSNLKCYSGVTLDEIQADTLPVNAGVYNNCSVNILSAVGKGLLLVGSGRSVISADNGQTSTMYEGGLQIYNTISGEVKSIDSSYGMPYHSVSSQYVAYPNVSSISKYKDNMYVLGSNIGLLYYNISTSKIYSMEVTDTFDHIRYFVDTSKMQLTQKIELSGYLDSLKSAKHQVWNEFGRHIVCIYTDSNHAVIARKGSPATVVESVMRSTGLAHIRDVEKKSLKYFHVVDNNLEAIEGVLSDRCRLYNLDGVEMTTTDGRGTDIASTLKQVSAGFYYVVDIGCNALYLINNDK